MQFRRNVKKNYSEFWIMSLDLRYVCPLEDQPGSRDKGERQIKDQFFTEHSIIWLGIKSYLKIACPMKRIQTKHQDPNNSLEMYFPDFYLWVAKTTEGQKNEFQCNSYKLVLVSIDICRVSTFPVMHISGSDQCGLTGVQIELSVTMHPIILYRTSSNKPFKPLQPTCGNSFHVTKSQT